MAPLRIVPRVDEMDFMLGEMILSRVVVVNRCQ
jgi:hypothetical protein